jgi:hypothetical protein
MDAITIPWTGDAGPNAPHGLVLPWIFEGAGGGAAAGGDGWLQRWLLLGMFDDEGESR